jgi:hypothetical protein
MKTQSLNDSGKTSRIRSLKRELLTPKTKTMGQSKIKTIQPNGTYEGRNGLMYKFEIELENGQGGEVSAKSEDRWKVGDEVEYEVTPSKWGDKMKLTKPGFQQGGGYKDDPEKTKRITASWAIGLAIQQASDPQEILEAAEHLINMRDSLISKL